MFSIKYSIKIENSIGEKDEINDITLASNTYNTEKYIIEIKEDNQIYKVKVTPRNNVPIANIKHIVSTELQNFHTVIAPDSGRNYPSNMQLVTFWSSIRESAVNDVKAPIYIFTGQDHNTAFAYGVVGDDYETRFRVLEPWQNRALQAHFRRLTLEISRGTDNVSIPKSISEKNADLSIEEGIFVRGKQSNSWIKTLEEFSKYFGKEFPRNQGSLEPLWCSWTDWHSSDMTQEKIIQNVKDGLEVGIKNFIIDDGWFGPGLDSDFGTPLVFGDWEADNKRYTDIKQLSDQIHELGGRSIIWCAPHTITPLSNAYRKNFKYLTKDKFGVPLMSGNKLNLFCPRCKEGREVMVDLCVKLALNYDTDGAKYDLFNIYPNEPCCAIDHEHDTESYVEGLYLLLELIWKKITAVKPDYIVELKQNYGWVNLSQFATMVRAGDTPYNPESNFMRTAFVQAYNQYAVNDYQTITNYDSVEDSARIVIKMMAVGIPTYSMDIAALTAEHKAILVFLHSIYDNMIKNTNVKRHSLDADLGIWKLCGDNDNYYFAVNEGYQINIDEKKNTKILNGSIYDEICLSFDFDGECKMVIKNCVGEVVKETNMQFDRERCLC